jgi:hypothetical protein
MNKSWFYLGAIGSLAIVVTSCGGDGGKQASTQTTSSTSSAVTSPTNAAVPPSTSKPAPIAVKPPTVPAATKPAAINLATGLIPPTDPDNWTKTVAKGRPDPFASLSLQPIQDPNLLKELSIATRLKSLLPGIARSTGGNSVPVAAIQAAGSGKDSQNIKISQIPRSGIDLKLPKITIALKPGSPSERSTTIGRSGATSNIAIKPLPQPLATPKPGATSNIAIKPLSQPLTTLGNSKKLARSIGVSGVIEVDGRTQVIVKLPNESFSRYVDVGSHINDGKIMVKRVEGEQTLSPIVVLEEAGMEITRRVGDTDDTVTKTAATDRKEPTK